MLKQPKIEYVDGYLTIGSAAKKVEKKNTVILLPNERRKNRTIYIDPVALAGIALAAVLLIGLLVGSLRFYFDWQENTRIHQTVLTLRQENTNLRYRYTSGFDREEIRRKARIYGMVPAEEAETHFITIHMPQPKEESGWLDEVIWFLSGLLERDP